MLSPSCVRSLSALGLTIPAWLASVTVLPFTSALRRCLSSLNGKAVPGPADGCSPGLAGKGTAFAFSDSASGGLERTIGGAR